MRWPASSIALVVIIVTSGSSRKVSMTAKATGMKNIWAQ